uniref:Sodium-coupled monocarboxylate transporter 1-like n=1 Tax=Callorhinchus milii TaxID=7868 RepID=A0A4W3HX80_CALMI
MSIMISGFLAVVIRATVVENGIAQIWNNSYHGGRLNFWDFNPDPLRRHTFWTIVIGGSFMWTAIYGINQSQVQRYISCKNKFEAKLSLYLNMIGLWVTTTCAVLTGLSMYSIYSQCDPLTANLVRTSDQLTPYLVMDILGGYPGVPGLFVAAAYSGTLSTVSSSINALAAVTVEDFIKPNINLSEEKLSWISKGLSKSEFIFSIISSLNEAEHKSVSYISKVLELRPTVLLSCPLPYVLSKPTPGCTGSQSLNGSTSRSSHIQHFLQFCVFLNVRWLLHLPPIQV